MCDWVGVGGGRLEKEERLSDVCGGRTVVDVGRGCVYVGGQVVGGR